MQGGMWFCSAPVATAVPPPSLWANPQPSRAFLCCMRLVITYSPRHGQRLWDSIWLLGDYCLQWMLLLGDKEASKQPRNILFFYLSLVKTHWIGENKIFVQWEAQGREKGLSRVMTRHLESESPSTSIFFSVQDKILCTSNTRKRLPTAPLEKQIASLPKNFRDSKMTLPIILINPVDIISHAILQMLKELFCSSWSSQFC